MRIAILLAAACAVATSQAQSFNFDLGPKDGEGYGLNGANEFPTPALGVSDAQGDEDLTLGGIVYDADDNVLHVNLIWGDHIDNRNGEPLSSAFAGAHIHLGAPGTETEDEILYDLTTGFNSGDSVGGATGFIGIDVQLVDQGAYTVALQEADLLGNLWYINIHSDLYPDGEIRGQLLNAIPEPQHYAAFAGIALLGFAGFRRYKAAQAA